MNGKKILVTGGAGFVGSNLCATLVRNFDCYVCSIDNYFTGSSNKHVPKVHYIEGETSDINKLIDFSPDVIFHLGEYSRVEQSFSDIERVIQYNVVGTASVLEFARETNAKLIYAGSSTKFADEGQGAIQSPYAWSKAKNTELVKQYGEWFQLDYAISYFYNVFGPGENGTGKYSTLIALFREKMKSGESLTIVKPGSQRRNFTHINDIVSGLILIAEAGSGDGYGIGSDEEYSITEVAAMFGGQVEFLPPRRGNRMSAELKCHRTTALGWRANERLESYITKLRNSDWEEV